MKIGVPKEIVAEENRVALVPEAIGPLLKAGMQILVERGAGEGAFIPDRAYEAVGATIVSDPAGLFPEANVVLKVQMPVVNPALGKHEVELMREGTVLISFLQPLSDPDLVKRLVERKITSFSMDYIPRIARAQRMDALSSQSTVAGYKAVLTAASSLGKFFPMLVTAAVTGPPAKVLVLGAGFLEAGTLYPIDGERLVGTLASLDTASSVVWRLPDGSSRTFPTDRVERIVLKGTSSTRPSHR